MTWDDQEANRLLETIGTVIADAEKVMQAHKNLSIAYLAVRLTNIKNNMDEMLKAHGRLAASMQKKITVLEENYAGCTERLDKASVRFEDMKIKLQALEDKVNQKEATG